MTKRRPTARELRAMGHHVADLIETKAAAIAKATGASREKAIQQAIKDMAA